MMETRKLAAGVVLQNRYRITEGEAQYLVMQLFPGKGLDELPAASLARDLNELLKISRAINAIRQPRAFAQQLLDSIFEIVPAE